MLTMFSIFVAMAAPAQSNCVSMKVQGGKIARYCDFGSGLVKVDSAGRPIQRSGDSLATPSVNRDVISVAAPDNQLQPDFRGSISYKGTYQGAIEARYKAPRRLNMRSIVSSLNSASSRPISGTHELTIVFNGAAIEGTMRGVGLARGGRFTGQRDGMTCSMTWNDGSRSSGHCDMKALNLRSTGPGPNGSTARLTLDGTATNLVDFAERDKQIAIDDAKKEAVSKTERQVELANRARLRAKLPKGASALYTPMLEKAVQADSKRWYFNSYKASSIDVLEVERGSAAGQTVIKASFEYEGGFDGWVGAIVQNSSILCLQFSDDPRGCRPVGDVMSRRLLTAGVATMLTPPSWISSGGPAYGSSADYERYEQRCAAAGRSPGNC